MAQKGDLHAYSGQLALLDSLSVGLFAALPEMGVSEQDARDVAAYRFTLRYDFGSPRIAVVARHSRISKKILTRATSVSFALS